MDDQPAHPEPLPWPLPGAEALRDALTAAYADPARAHHGTTHLREVLTRLEELEAAGTPFDRTAVHLAAWFHDAVYDGERDAEERSAAWAEEALVGLVEPATVAEVVRLVRLTEHHRPEPDDAAGCALSDADLAILAADPARYDAYAAAVRREYAHLDDATFAEGRIDVLRSLTAGEHLFATDHGRRSWEAPARANVARELSALGATPARSGA